MRNLYVFALLAGSALAQNPAPPAFEVASVKINKTDPSSAHVGIEARGNSLSMRFMTLRIAIAWAYDIQRPQIVGPDWIDTERYEIQAKAPRTATENEMKVMLQPVLAERFKLAFHRETRSVPVMVITVPKEGHKMTPSTDKGPPDIVQDPVRGPMVKRAPLKELAEDVSHDANVPVLDQTGLAGTYDFAFNVQKYVNAARSRAASSATRMSEAELKSDLMQELLMGELGLKLESKKAPVEMFLIDHAEQKPVEN
jgi:uncharacterized protein (TIGR03435 family)